MCMLLEQCSRIVNFAFSRLNKMDIEKSLKLRGLHNFAMERSSSSGLESVGSSLRVEIFFVNRF